MPRATPKGKAATIRHDSLLVPLWARGVIGHSAATWTPTGELDIDAIVATLAAARPLDRLPRQNAPTLRRGVQVLVDRGDGMQPFLRDIDQMLDTVRLVVGTSATDVLRFRDDPRTAGPGPERTWVPYRAPGPEIPVMVLSDLGVLSHGRRRLITSAWLDLVDGLSERGSRVIAFVPVPVDRCPPRLRRVMTLIQWDRCTSIRDVSRALGRRRR